MFALSGWEPIIMILFIIGLILVTLLFLVEEINKGLALRRGTPDPKEAARDGERRP